MSSLKKDVFKLLRFLICLIAVYCTGYIVTLTVLTIIKPPGEFWSGSVIAFYIYIFLCMAATIAIGRRFFRNNKDKSCERDERE